VHSVVAGALAGVRLTANIPTETVAARSALRREDLDRTLPDGITPSTGSSYVSDEFAEKPVPEGETSHLRQIGAAALGRSPGSTRGPSGGGVVLVGPLRLFGGPEAPLERLGGR
jgi:hypothetical protein